MWVFLEAGAVGMKIWIAQMPRSGKFLYAGHAKFPQLKLIFSSRNSHQVLPSNDRTDDNAIKRPFPERKEGLSLSCM